MSLISIDNKKIRRFRRATPVPFMPQSSESNRVGDRAHQGIAGAAQQRRQCQLIELRQSVLPAMPKSALPMRRTAKTPLIWFPKLHLLLVSSEFVQQAQPAFSSTR
jgi:hypothetical protein